MKNIANSLMPLAVLVFFGTCLVSVFCLLVVLMTSVGFADGLPLFYFQRLNVAAISVALPMAGMILFAAILLGLPRKSAEAAKPDVIKGVKDVVERIESGKASGLEITTRLIGGSAREVILDEAERWDADLIVLGSHGWRHG